MSVNIILIGLMGAGKTTVGKSLLKILSDYSFVDIDEEIEKQENMPISQIFKEKSEDYFREIETEIIKKFSLKENQIISTGGGAYEKEENRKYLSENGKVFYLYAPYDVLFERIKQDNTRPLLYTENPKEKLKELLNLREINYKRADYIIDTANLSIKEVVKEILKEIK